MTAESTETTPSATTAKHPAATSHLLGHEAAEATLLSALNSGRLHHGWLICGASGIGKATLAYRFARYLLAKGAAVEEGTLLGLDIDEDPAPSPTLYVDESHPVARRIAAGGHGDLMVVERTRRENGTLRDSIVIDDARRIEGLFRRTAAEGGWRIVIVDEADTMNPAAQNAILKILEEPPEGALILLTAESPGRLLPTIRSRVRKLTLNPLSPQNMASLITHHIPDASAEERLGLIALSQGSIGQALRIHEADAVALYRDFLGIVSGGHKISSRQIIDFAERFAGKDGEAAYALMARFIPDWLASVAKLAATNEMIERLSGEGSAAITLYQRLGLEQCLALWDKCRALFMQASGLNLDRKQVMLSVVFAIRSQTSEC